MSRLFSYLVIVLLMSSCSFLDKRGEASGTDPFYTDRGGFGQPRIPLVKPYELRKVNESEWRMELLNTDVALSVHNVKGVNVNGTKIILLSEGGTDFRFKQHDKGWLIVDAAAPHVQFFLTYMEYVSALKAANIADTMLLLPDRIYENFESSGTIPWK